MNNTDTQIEIAKMQQTKDGSQRKIQRRRYQVGHFSAAIITAIAIWFLATLHWPFTVTHLDDIIISTDPIAAGQYQRYSAGICDNPGVEGEVVRNIVLKGTDEAPISSTRVPVRPIECSNIILIPENLPNGTYEVTLHIIYHVNPVRDALNPVVRDFRSAPFKVEGGKNISIPSDIKRGTVPDNKNVNLPARAEQSNSTPKPAPVKTPRASQPSTPVKAVDNPTEPEAEEVQPARTRLPIVSDLLETSLLAPAKSTLDGTNKLIDSLVTPRQREK